MNEFSNEEVSPLAPVDVSDRRHAWNSGSNQPVSTNGIEESLDLVDFSDENSDVQIELASACDTDCNESQCMSTCVLSRSTWFAIIMRAGEQRIRELEADNNCAPLCTTMAVGISHE